MIWWLPLEKIDQRYTEQTFKIIHRNFTHIFGSSNFECIDGIELNSSSSLNPSQFLDPVGTMFYKSSQILKVCSLIHRNLIKDGDTFFVDDIWFPGLISLKYIFDFNKLNVLLTGILHAGSHTPSDDVATLIGQKIKGFERSIIDCCSSVFVGSRFHYQELCQYHSTIFKNVHVTGLVVDTSNIINSVKWTDRKNQIIFPGRLHYEKGYNVIKNLEKILPVDIKIIKTHELDLNKLDYYNLLSNSKLVLLPAIQENFGYAIIEAVAAGCNILVPNRAVYSEFYDKVCLYDPKISLLELYDKIKFNLCTPQRWKKNKFLLYVNGGIRRITNVLLKKTN